MISLNFQVIKKSQIFCSDKLNVVCDYVKLTCNKDFFGFNIIVIFFKEKKKKFEIFKKSKLTESYSLIRVGPSVRKSIGHTL